MSTRTTGRGPKQKHFWAKWYWHRWLNEPTLITAGNEVQGFWANLLNRMMASESATLDAPEHEYALLGYCRESEVASRLHALQQRGIADVEEANGRIRVTCRSMAREWAISQERSKAARARWESRKKGENAARAAETGAPVIPVPVAAPAVETELFADTFAYANGVHTSNSDSISPLSVQDGVQGKDAPPVAETVSVAATTAASEDLQPLVAQIILAHPRVRQRQWAQHEIPYSDRIETAKAVRAEAERTGTTPTEAGLQILALVQELASATPETEWHYVKDVVPFMQKREYRVPPKTNTAHGGSHAQPAHDRASTGARPSPSTERRDRSRAAILAAGEYFTRFTSAGADGADAGPVPPPGTGRDDGPDVDGGVAGDGDPTRGKPPGRVVEGAFARRDTPKVHAHTG